MARLNDEGQWIVLMGFVVAISLFFLALIISESTLVGQTTSEAVLDLSKSDIQNLQAKVKEIAVYDVNVPSGSLDPEMAKDISMLYLERKNAVVNVSVMNSPTNNVTLHYNNGVTSYNAFVEEELDRGD